MLFTTPDQDTGLVAFQPMDPITVYLKRLSGFPVRVFTGFLDQAPYLQLYPGVVSLRASCTLKRLLYTYFDPSLQYTQTFLSTYGWAPSGNGSWYSTTGMQETKNAVGGTPVSPGASPTPGSTPPKTGATASAPSGSGALYVGDSLGEGSKPELSKLVPGLISDVRQNRASTEATKIVLAKINKNFKSIILDIGTNDFNISVLVANLRKVYGKVGSNQQLILMTVRGPNAAAKNKAIAAFAAGKSNVSIADTASLNVPYDKAQNIHPQTPGSYQKRAAIIAATVNGGSTITGGGIVGAVLTAAQKAAVISDAKEVGNTNDGSLGQLLYATLKHIGNWNKDEIYIEALPDGIYQDIAARAQQQNGDNVAALNELSELFKKIVGGPSMGQMGAPGTGSVDLSGINGDVPGQVYQVAKKFGVADDSKLMLAAFETGLVEAPIDGNKSFGNPIGGDQTGVPGSSPSRQSSGWRQETLGAYPGVDRHNVVEAAGRYFSEAKKIMSGGVTKASSGTYSPSWTAGHLAQAIQGSATPDAYDKVESQAKALLHATIQKYGSAANSSSGQTTGNAIGSVTNSVVSQAGSVNKTSTTKSGASPRSVSPGATASSAGQDIAKQLLAKSNITWQPTSDKASTRDGVQAIANGQRAICPHTGQRVAVNVNMLQAMLTLSNQGFSVNFSAMVNGTHSSEASDHYKGRAIDISDHTGHEDVVIKIMTAAGGVSSGENYANNGHEHFSFRSGQMSDSGAAANLSGPGSGGTTIGGVSYTYPLTVKGPVIATPQDHIDQGRGGSWQNEGWDIGVPVGTQAVACCDCTIDKAYLGTGALTQGWQISYTGAGGKRFFYNLHGGGVKDPQVVAGAKLKMGDKIGLTGFTNAAHLHFSPEDKALGAKLVELQPGGMLVDGAAATSGSTDQNGLPNPSSAAFSATINLGGALDTVTANLLTGPKALMNDVPLFPFIEQLAQASLRQFQSLPDGKIYAFYPDFFGEYNHHPPYWLIDDIELIDGGLDLSDDGLVTHQYVVGDTSATAIGTDVPGGQRINMVNTSGVVSVINAFMTAGVLTDSKSVTTKGKTITGKDKKGKSKTPSYGQEALLKKSDAILFLERFGARPVVENMPMIRHPYFEYFLAYQKFLIAWSKQFVTPFTFTFMPELFPGGRVGFPDHGLQMYIDSVTHDFDYTSGFTTTAQLSCPSVMIDKNGKPVDNAHNLPNNMVMAMTRTATSETVAKQSAAQKLAADLQQIKDAASTVVKQADTFVDQIKHDIFGTDSPTGE
jgi:hypothetical protein